jgi:hypothetical protein
MMKSKRVQGKFQTSAVCSPDLGLTGSVTVPDLSKSDLKLLPAPAKDLLKHTMVMRFCRRPAAYFMSIIQETPTQRKELTLLCFAGVSRRRCKTTKP